MHDTTTRLERLQQELERQKRGLWNLIMLRKQEDLINEAYFRGKHAAIKEILELLG